MGCVYYACALISRFWGKHIMADRDPGKRRYLVLPSRGISGAAMQASVFQEKTATFLTRTLGAQLKRFSAVDAGTDSAGVLAFAAAPTAGVELTRAIDDKDFEIISQRFDDGPATVAMTHSARLALEASNPDVRVVPITRYYLPGERPWQAKSGADPATRIAAESALDTNGKVYLDDFKQHVLANAQGGAEGKGVVVGLLDTGVDNTHAALKGKVAALRCFIPGVPSTAGGPVNWGAARAAQAAHGTHVAGIIVAGGDAGGPQGVAPNAQVISYRIFPDNPTRMKGAENPPIIDSIRSAINDGCHIVNLSIEGPTLKADGVPSAIADAWDNGVLCVAAAGNGSGNPVSYPAALPHCIAVTAIGRRGTYPGKSSFSKFLSDQAATSDPDIFLASFSNFGPQVQFTAPGLAIVSTFPNNEWWFDSGTSMAAPFISGILARLLSDNTNILKMAGDAQRSAAMLQMLVGRARVLGLPQVSQEGYGLPI
jgi:Subtilase family